ncbi:MAG: hypothetical protein V1793_24055 [Pseudomonadota bacterium]
MIVHLSIPMPLLVCVDDVGWWSGTDGSRWHQPYRTGMGRRHVPEDYSSLALLGQRLGMKILAGFVLCEWDRNNLLKDLPSSTWMGSDWDNDSLDPDLAEQAAHIIRSSQHTIEIGLHGVGHEFWSHGVMHRAEFHDAECRMRNSSVIKKHLEFFHKLMDQYSFSGNPVSFIPPAMKHSFGNGDDGFQKLLNDYGIRYAFLNFHKVRQYTPPQAPGVAWESGVVLLDRGESECAWNEVSCKPVFSFDRPVLALHWINLLHENPDRNKEVVIRWADFLEQGAMAHGCILSPDTRACFTQYLHRTCSTVVSNNGVISLDLKWMEKLPATALDDSFVVCITSQEFFGFKVSGAAVSVVREGITTRLLRLTPYRQAKTVTLVFEKSDENLPFRP